MKKMYKFLMYAVFCVAETLETSRWLLANENTIYSCFILSELF